MRRLCRLLFCGFGIFRTGAIRLQKRAASPEKPPASTCMKMDYWEVQPIRRAMSILLLAAEHKNAGAV